MIIPLGIVAQPTRTHPVGRLGIFGNFLKNRDVDAGPARVESPGSGPPCPHSSLMKDPPKNPEIAAPRKVFGSGECCADRHKCLISN